MESFHQARRPLILPIWKSEMTEFHYSGSPAYVSRDLRQRKTYMPNADMSRNIPRGIQSILVLPRAQLPAQPAKSIIIWQAWQLPALM